MKGVFSWKEVEMEIKTWNIKICVNSSLREISNSGDTSSSSRTERCHEHQKNKENIEHAMEKATALGTVEDPIPCVSHHHSFLKIN
jgi:hypothetical protein